MRLAVVATLVVCAALWAHPADATPAAAGPRVVVIQVGGMLDPINAALLRTSLAGAKRSKAEAVVLQLDSSRSTLSEREVAALAALLGDPSLPPIAAWVGPAGRGRATAATSTLYETADIHGMAPGTRIGIGRTVDDKTALREGRVDIVSPTVADFIGRLDGVEVRGHRIHTAEPHVDGQPYVLARDLQVAFASPGLIDRTQHALGSPSAVYFLLVAGLLLILFEFFSAGIGLAAGSGAICLALSAYGIGVLPTRPLGVGLLVAATVAFGIDIQTGQPRFWTGFGTVALAVGSWTMFGAGFRPGWLALALVISSSLIVVLFGIPSTVRTRFSTPTIGREGLIGSVGIARTDISPEGTVEIDGTPWRARTFPAAIKAGDQVVVLAIEDLVLEVVPAGSVLEPSRADRKAGAGPIVVGGAD